MTSLPSPDDFDLSDYAPHTVEATVAELAEFQRIKTARLGGESLVVTATGELLPGRTGLRILVDELSHSHEAALQLHRELSALDPHECLVVEAVTRLEINSEAKRRYDVANGIGEAAIASLMIDGGTFVFDIPDGIPSLWGHEQDVLWPEGEALIIAGPPGVGKTTLVHQVIEMMLTPDGGNVLGLHVRPLGDDEKLLVLACDRPGQIARAMRRRLKHLDRALVAESLVIWAGPPPGDFAKDTDLLTRLCRTAGATRVIIDSLKDVALGLSEDAVGAGLNQSRQKALAAGIQVLELHHLVKRGPDGAAPTKLADLYGSAWITAGAGSVALLWGEAGDLVVKLVHLKQPGHEVGPWTVIHDHDAGTSSVEHAAKVEDFASTYQGGVTAAKAAERLFDTEHPTRSQVEKARRKLDAAVQDGKLKRIDGGRGGDIKTPTRYFPLGDGGAFA